MSYRVEVVCRPEVAPGFGLAGVRAVEVDALQDTASTVATLIAGGDVGLLLIEAPLYDAIPQLVLRRMARLPLPVVVPFPAPDWQEGGATDEYIIEMLRQAIGYQVRLR